MNSVLLAIESIKNSYGINIENDASTPIDFQFDNLENSRIVIKESLREKLNNISITTTINQKEIGFIMYGKEYLDNQVLLDDISISDAPLKSYVTEFGSEITKELDEKIKENIDSRTVIVYCHTHPNLSEEYEFFSLSDIASLIELTNNVGDFYKKDIQLMGCLLTNNLKFIYYNPDDNKFYSMNNIEF